jgi:hypothetical protein
MSLPLVLSVEDASPTLGTIADAINLHQPMEQLPNVVELKEQSIQGFHHMGNIMRTTPRRKRDNIDNYN